MDFVDENESSVMNPLWNEFYFLLYKLKRTTENFEQPSLE